ncbi:DUF3515 domain-containing protein [Nocardioides donggukensis]|uniref:DUF3515 domain-containing protein n=1 Tax=Nocardioides donggukensis TaxID=2774019 RepID=A0A927K228_9ACTN|nr:DUF3515 domain-containing protein [Nocardioides donggukensis]MBD8869007.1 DUF3515 domain-containing protein [Nocardioides donggukensis]
MPLRAGGVVASALLLAGCAGPVEIDAPPVDNATARACAAFVEALPADLDGAERRDTTPAEARGAAWGDPAVTVTCGVGEPDGFTRFSACEEVDGVGWYVPDEQLTDQGADAELTTIGVEPAVRLLVPAERRPPSGILVELSAVVADTLELARPCV